MASARQPLRIPLIGDDIVASGPAVPRIRAFPAETAERPGDR